MSKKTAAAVEAEDQQQNEKRNKIVRDYAEQFQELKRAPKMDELVALGHTKDSVKHHFSSLSNLESIARNEFPQKFFDVPIVDFLGDSATSNLHKTIKSYKRFVITTAVTGCEIHEGFYSSLKSFCKKNKAALLILVASDPAHSKANNRGGYGSIDARLTNECVVVEDTHLNSNFFISTIKLSAKQINPTTGLSDIGQREGSFVFASPKQSMTLESTSNEKLPHVMMTTGAITVPNYVTNLYMSERTAYIADKHHVMGAVIVTIHDENNYAYTQIQMLNESGSFVHFGKRYFPDGTVSVDSPEALVCGDWHSGVTDPVVQKVTEEILKEFKPKYVVLHDAFDGLSINHHEEQNEILKAARYASGINRSLQEEIQGLSKDLMWFSKLAKEIVVVKSNHDEFLSNNYLKFAKYARDPQNHYFSLDLAKAMMEGKDPLKFAVEKVGFKAKNIRWLKRDEDFKIADIQLGAHGDVGASGSKGTLKGMRKAYGQSVTGHSHSPGIWHGAYAVGTSSYLRLNYNRGPGSWMHTHCLVYADGSRQLVNMIEGKWRL